MEILKKAWINMDNLSKEEKENFIKHYEDNENIVILTNNKNIEYKIINIIDNIINLEFTGVIYE